MIGVELLSASPEDSRSDFECFPELIADLRARLDPFSKIPEPPEPPVIA